MYTTNTKGVLVRLTETTNIDVTSVISCFSNLLLKIMQIVI